MKPISVRYKCFGPYMEEQLIDFELLSRSGLFLICGETGAGKTTLLDAMCYALYGKSSGGMRGDLEAMRCKLAERTDETLVEFIFEVGGKRYKFTRRLWYGARKGAKNIKDEHNCLLWKDGGFVPVFENPTQTKVNEKAAELIGLSYDQFRQVIILPQGQFERLLVSESADKERILVSLFRADRWQNAIAKLKEQVDARDAALKSQRQEILAGLAVHGCATLGELAARIGEKSAELEVLKAAQAQAEAESQAKKKLYESAILENAEFAELEKRRQNLAALQRRIPAQDAEDALLSRADRAEALKPEYDALMQSLREKKNAEAESNQAVEALQQAKSAFELATGELTRHEASRAACEEAKKQAVLLREAREVYDRLTQTRERMEAMQASEKQMARRRDAAVQTFELSDRTLTACTERQDAAMAAYRDAQARYIQGIGGRLAQSLQPGEPCPVCGSREHPAPAVPGEAHVTDAELDRLESGMTRAVQEFRRARQARQEAEAAKNEVEQRWQQADQEAALARAAHEHAVSRCIDGIENAEQLERRIAQLEKRIDAYEKRGAELQQGMANAQTGLGKGEALTAQCAAYLQRCVDELQRRTDAWKLRLEDGGFEDHTQFKASLIEHGELQRRKNAAAIFRGDVRAAEAALDEQQAKLEGRQAPDVSGLRLLRQEAEDALQSVREQCALAGQSLQAMERDRERWADRLKLYETERIAVDEDMTFVGHLVGSRGVSLQRYVLGVMLTAITNQANRLLENVHGGRYRLYRTDETAGSSHKKGLELEVLDRLSNTRRSVATLSGGEKFLVSLSLAIGLSTVVQAQGGGVRMEAMFIDEGFGSLDADSIGDALDVLQTVQRSKGMVGIISHVERLRETIPARIEVTKGKNGSICRVYA